MAATGGRSGPQSHDDAEGNRAVDGGQRVPRFAPQLIVWRGPWATLGCARDLYERLLAPLAPREIRGIAAASSSSASFP